MTAPRKPLTLDPSKTYIHLTTTSDAPIPSTSIGAGAGVGASTPIVIADADANTGVSSGARITLVGPVGELEREFVYELTHASASGPARDSGGPAEHARPSGHGATDEVLAAVRRMEGVKAAAVLETKQRAKR